MRIKDLAAARVSYGYRRIHVLLLREGNKNMSLITELLKGLVQSISWGIVFLLLAFLLLPNAWFRWILRRIKPDFTSKELVLDRVKTILDFLLNKKDVVVEELSSDALRDRKERMSALIKEKDALESNLFFLDLLKSLASMTHFSVAHAGFGQDSACLILNYSMEYLMHYAKEIKQRDSADNQPEGIQLAAADLQNQVNDAIDFLRTDEGKEKGEIVQSTLKQGTAQFDSFMRKEYESTKNRLSRVKQLLADRLIEYVEGDL
jgi:hypothetical protein